MVKRIGKIAGAAAVVALLVYAGAVQSPPSAQAAPPPPCPAAPGVGSITYRVFATVPVGAGSSGVCITLAGTGGTLNGGTVIQAPPACPAISPPAVDAGGSMAWTDWGAPCMAGGQSVVLQFHGMAGIPLGRQPGAANWGGGVMSDATVWPSDCPAAPLAAAPVLYTAVAPVPIGGPYDGVCIKIPGAGGLINAPAVLVNPPGCGAPALSAPNAPASVVGPFFGAAVNQFWVDWTAKCVTGGSLKIQFKGPAGLVGLCAACATWLDAAVSGDVTITLASLGGLDQAPDAALSPVRTSPGSGVYTGWYVAAVAAVLLSVVGASGWYLKRRRSE